jgi:hypothetical protein
MTFLAASIGDDYGLMSQDTAVAFVPPAAVAAMVDNLRHRGRKLEAGAKPVVSAHLDKMYLFRDLRLAVGKIGTAETTAPMLKAIYELSGIDDLAKRGREIWLGWPAWLRAAPLIVVAVGWSHSHGYVRRVMLQSTTEMKPQYQLEPHLVQPPTFDDDPAAPEIRRLHRRELALDEARRLHWLLGRSAARASQTGSYGSHGVIGGRLMQAVVTEAGAELWDAGGLDAVGTDDMPEPEPLKQTTMRTIRQGIALNWAVLRHRYKHATAP